MRFHVVGLAHTVTSKLDAWSSCAYTGKVFRFAEMLTGLGHHVIHYGAEGSTPPCAEHVTIISAAEQSKLLGDDPWKRMQMPFDHNAPQWKMSNHRAIAEIAYRKAPRDFVCLIGGLAQKPIADAFLDLMCVEYGIGYHGIIPGCKHVFESHTHQSLVYGQQSRDPEGNLYDAVIPNYYDVADLPFGEGRGDYLLFMARLISRKGLQIALAIQRETGLRLVIAGNGAAVVGDRTLVTEDGMRIPLGGPIGYEGCVGPRRRAELMGGARCLLLPTTYFEPFGGVVCEAALQGTPAITTNFGAFAETVEHGVTGYRCSSLAQFCNAACNCGELDRGAIRARAISLYSLQRVSRMYETYFQLLYSLWGQGWADMGADAVRDLDWLKPLPAET